MGDYCAVFIHILNIECLNTEYAHSARLTYGQGTGNGPLSDWTFSCFNSIIPSVPEKMSVCLKGAPLMHGHFSEL